MTELPLRDRFDNEGTYAMTTTITLSAHFPGDGGDALEVEAELPFVPRKGDELAIWVEGSTPTSGEPYFFTVTHIVVDTWDQRTVAALSTDGHTPTEVEEAFAAYRAGAKP